jgi:iron complex transport system permease protein
MSMALSMGAGSDGRALVSPWRSLPIVWLMVAMALVAGAFLAATLGAVPVRAADTWAGMTALMAGDDTPLSGPAHVWWHIRLPRVMLALLAGASLGLAGALTQGLFRNPLADPGLLGVSSGAACATALGIVLFNSLSDVPLPASWRPYVLPLLAFGGALLTCLTLDGLARWLTPGSIAGLLLTGVAINAAAGAAMGLASYLATDEQLRSLTFWTLGSVAGGNWAVVGMLSGLVLTVGAVAWRLAPALNAMALGEDAAGHVGVDLRRMRAGVVLLVALSCGSAVAWCGMIGFIGLLAPHLARSWAGPDHRSLLPLSMALGAGVLLAADTLARTCAMPAEIPVGIFTAMLGGPLLVLMMRGQARTQGSAA